MKQIKLKSSQFSLLTECQCQTTKTSQFKLLSRSLSTVAKSPELLFIANTNFAPLQRRERVRRDEFVYLSRVARTQQEEEQVIAAYHVDIMKNEELIINMTVCLSCKLVSRN